MIDATITKKIFRALHAAADDLPESCYISITIPNRNETHRFTVQSSCLGHLESHDIDSVQMISQQEQQIIRVTTPRISELQGSKFRHAE